MEPKRQQRRLDEKDSTEQTLESNKQSRADNGTK